MSNDNTKSVLSDMDDSNPLPINTVINTNTSTNTNTTNSTTTSSNHTINLSNLTSSNILPLWSPSNVTNTNNSMNSNTFNPTKLTPISENKHLSKRNINSTDIIQNKKQQNTDGNNNSNNSININDEDDDNDNNNQDDKNKSLRYDEDAEDISNDKGDSATYESAINTEDESFFDLLNHFAHLEFENNDPNRPEACPICNIQFPLSQFAEHVYECIKKLDDEEKKAVEKLDEDYARKLAQSNPENYIYNTMEESKFQKSQICDKGENCKRMDAKHFELMYHPEVNCPVCGASFQVFEINAHINLCLLHPPPPTQTNNGNKTKSSFVNAMDDTNMSATNTQNPNTSKSPVLFPPNQQSSAFSTVRSTSNSIKQRQRSNDSLTDANDNDDDDDNNNDNDELNNSNSSNNNNNNTGRTIGGLTIEAASALSKAVIAKQNDPSLVSLLETFKTLGFTAENLNKIKQSQAQKATSPQPNNNNSTNNNNPTSNITTNNTNASNDIKNPFAM